MSTFLSSEAVARASRPGIAASRRGLRTLLIENLTSLGGTMTNGYVTGPAGMIEGICKELLDRLKKQGFSLRYARIRRPSTPSAANSRWRRCFFRAGCRILYCIRAVDVIMDGPNIKSVVCYSKSGRCEIGRNTSSTPPATVISRQPPAPLTMWATRSTWV